MAVVIGVAVALIILGALLTGIRSWTRSAEPPRRIVTVARRSGTPGRATVTVNVSGVDPETPAVRRLLDGIAAQAFAALPEVDTIEIVSAGGTTLTVRHRSHPLPRLVDVPADRIGPPHHSRGPLVADADRPDRAHPHFVAGDVPKPRPIADRFELPPGVRARLRDHDDAVDLVAAIVSAGGATVVVDGPLLHTGDAVVIVLPARIGEPVGPDRLNHAYRLFEASKARQGIVVTPGHLDSHDVRRRELLAPRLVHAGPDGIQRMADAVTIGADPLFFVLPMQLEFTG